LAVCVEQLILGHAYDEYLVLSIKTRYDTWYLWYQISSAAPDCLASKLYYDELDLPVLVKLPSALPGLKLVRRVLLSYG
jgi:hypothetical protein